MKTTDKPINYNIRKIKEVALNYQEPIEILRAHKDDIDSFYKRIQYALGVNYFWDIKKNSFNVVLDIHYGYLNENKIIDLLRFSNVTEFIVLDLVDIFEDKGNGEFEMDKTLETTFVSLAISSGRGMLASRTAGTVFGSICFPLINPADYIVSKKQRRLSGPEKNEKF